MQFMNITFCLLTFWHRVIYSVLGECGRIRCLCMFMGSKKDHRDFPHYCCLCHSDKINDFIETSESDMLELAPCNGFQRKLIYQTIRTK